MPERLKIVVFYPALYGEGGVPYETRSLIAALRRQGCDTLSIAREPGAGARVRATKQVIENFTRSDEGPAGDRRLYRNLLFSTPELIGAIRAFAPDICFVIGARRPETAYFALCMKLAGFDYVIFAHGLYSPETLVRKWGGGLKSPWVRRLETCYRNLIDLPYLRNALGARALSASEQEALQSLGGRNVFVVPDGIDKAWLRGAERPLRADGLVRLLYLGRLEEYQKGLDIVVAAFGSERLRAGFEVTIAGPGHEKYLALAKQRIGGVLPSCVRVVGPAFGEDKDVLLDWADFFLHISRYEGMAKSAREALGSGIPLIASFQSNFGDWTRDRGMGIAVDASTESVISALVELRNLSAPVYAGMRGNALRFAQGYSWDGVARETIHHIRILRAGA